MADATANLVAELNRRYPELEITVDDIELSDPEWPTIDGMEPFEWADAMTME